MVSPVPGAYPTACSPQAWATAAPFVFLKVMLGLVPSDGTLRLDPCVPDAIGRIVIRRLHAFGTEWDIEASGGEGEVRRAAR